MDRSSFALELKFTLYIQSVCLIKIKKSAYFIFQLIFVTFMSSTTLFGTIHESHYTILINFYIYLQYFQ